MKSIAFPLMVALTSFLTACAPITTTSIPTPTPSLSTATPTITTSSSPTPSPPLEIHSLTLLPGDAPQDWTVIGILENSSHQQLTEILVQIILWDTAGTQLAQQVVPPLLSGIGPGESSPFVARFLDIGTAVTSSAALATYQVASFERGQVGFEVLTRVPTGDGGIAILGQVENLQSHTVILEELGFTVVNPEGKLLGLTTSSIMLSTLGSNEITPFLSLLEKEPDGYDLVPYIDARKISAPTQTDISILAQPSIFLTEQGLPFVVGEVSNDGDQAYWTTLLITLESGNQLISISQFQYPIPLRPGERRGFAISDFPGLKARLEQLEAKPETLVAKTFVDHHATHPTDQFPVTLDFQITLYEPIGSTLILKGSVANPYGSHVEQATVIATVNSTSGMLVTGGWTQVSESLAAGDTAEFILPLQLPQGSNPSMYEYDLLAMGLFPRE